jgi:hypothetical protein
VAVLPNLVGITGVLLMLAAYFLSQRGALTVHDARYLWLNLLGAVAVVFSLFREWNLPAFLIESAWAAISAYSLIRRKQP